MTTEVLAPASASPGVDKFLTSTLAKPTVPAPANEKKDEVKTVTPPAEAAKADAAPPAYPAPSDGEKKTDAPPPNFEAIQKQLGEQTRANKKLGKSNIELLQRNKQLMQDIEKLKEQFDPSYTPPVGLTPEQEKEKIEFAVREDASKQEAEKRYGLETVQAKIYADDGPFGQLVAEQPWQLMRLKYSQNPVLEAFQILEESEVLNTYGRSTTAVLENVSKAVKDQHWKEWTAQAKLTPADSPGKPVATLGDARGDGGGNEARQTPKFDLHSFNRHIP